MGKEVMEYVFKCWQCPMKFVGHDSMPCANDMVCPRCGAGSRAWIPTMEDKLRGTKYYDAGTGLILRSGREHQELYAHGYLKLKTHDSDILEVCDVSDYTPSV